MLGASPCRFRPLGVLAALLASAAGAGPALDPSIAARRDWVGGAARYRAGLLQLVTGPRLPDAEALMERLRRYELCRLLARATSSGWNRAGEDDALLRRLLASRGLAHTLALAVRPEDAPARVLAVLSAILPADRPAPAASPDLCVAIAVVWDSRVRLVLPAAGAEAPPARRGLHVAAEDADRLRGLLAHYARLPRLPWELAVFAVDGTVSEAERAWAAARYAGRADCARLLEEPPHDPQRTAWARGTPRTLGNLRIHGGDWGDRAQFAVQVAKACGRPCFVIRGPTRVGAGRAWAIELAAEGTGGTRWEAHGPEGKPLGDTEDPQTGQRRSLCEARLLARSLSLPASRRTAGEAAFRAARLFRGDLPAARTLTLLGRAARSNPYDPRPWLMLSEMMGRKEAAHAKAGALYRFLLARFRRYPEFTSDILHALLPLVPEDDVVRRRRLYEATFRVYRADPDVVVGLMMELAAYLHAHGKPQAALATYQALVEQYRDQGHLVEKALRSAERLTRRPDARAHVIALYEQAFQAYRDREAEALEHGRSSFYYRFADRLSRLYHRAGERAKAAEYDRICDRVDQALDAAR